MARMLVNKIKNKMEEKMKRVNFLMIFFFSFIAFSLEKSGIKEYDSLDFSRGEIIAYYDKDSNL